MKTMSQHSTENHMVFLRYLPIYKHLYQPPPQKYQTNNKKKTQKTKGQVLLSGKGTWSQGSHPSLGALSPLHRTAALPDSETVRERTSFAAVGFTSLILLVHSRWVGKKSLDNKLEGSLGQEEEEDKKLIFNVLAPS